LLARCGTYFNASSVPRMGARSVFMRALTTLVFLAIVPWAAACGKNNTATPDAAPEVDARAAICGNGLVEDGEDCDDDDRIIDVVCTADCKFTCGDGVVEGDLGELCDDGITSGEGACPSSCDDGAACTSDVATGTGCQAACQHAPITEPANGDGCCPEGANPTNDDDCAPGCGNGVVDPGETCDTGIATGPGSCPTSCDDQLACTTDAPTGSACTAACTHTPITQPHNGDGCCPPGANSGNDNDCSASCGNGHVDPGERCDTGIASGAGSCPTAQSCNDQMACTRDVIDQDHTCAAQCVHQPVTMPNPSDMCCVSGENQTTDPVCEPVCGNRVVERGEQCDDGNDNANDGCAACMTVAIPPTAFRFTDVDLRDPHVFVSIFGCRDLTDTAFGGFSVNGKIHDSLTTDGTDDPDAFLDLSPVLLFKPLAQGQSTNAVEFHFADCTVPAEGTTCHPGANPPSALTATNQPSGTCLDILPGTVSSAMYTPVITVPMGVCFATNTQTVTFHLGAIPVTLTDATIGAVYVGNPATGLVNGLLRGFVSETSANETILPDSLPIVNGKPLSALLPGGDRPPVGGNDKNCAAHSDKDTNNGVSGWWFYLNFVASPVTWTNTP